MLSSLRSTVKGNKKMMDGKRTKDGTAPKVETDGGA
jgi:hypothetical protein